MKLTTFTSRYSPFNASPSTRRPMGAPAYHQTHTRQITRPVMGQGLPAAAPGNLPADLFGTAIFSAMAYVGIRSGIKEKGFVSILGWGTGVVAGLLGLTALSMVARDISTVAVPA